MSPRRSSATKLWTAIVAAAMLGTALGTPARAHHVSDTCNEVGLWDEQDSVAYKEAAHDMMVHVSVEHIPPARACGTNASPTSATQHSSLHARSKDGSKCLEVVASRSSSGTIVMYGYNCDNFNDGGTTHTITGYGHSEMLLWMSTGGAGTSWSTWYFRRDFNRWVYLADVTANAKMVPWAESSGYNASSQRTTSFRSYQAMNEFGTWFPSFSCGVSNAFSERHQSQVTKWAGDVAYEPNAISRCR